MHSLYIVLGFMKEISFEYFCPFEVPVPPLFPAPCPFLAVSVFLLSAFISCMYILQILDLTHKGKHVITLSWAYFVPYGELSIKIYFMYYYTENKVWHCNGLEMYGFIFLSYRDFTKIHVASSFCPLAFSSAVCL